MASRITTFIVVLIVTGTLVAGLIVGAQRDAADGPVDLIITNGRVFQPADGTFAEAVAVRGNKILRVGSNRQIKRLRRPQTVTIDAHGASVLPGFNDSHTHLLSGGLSLEHLDLLGATTLERIEDSISAYAEAHPHHAWVRGRGWSYEPFPAGLPTREMLDALVPDRPAYLTAYDGHTAWVNSKALALAGITRRTLDPENGTIVRDARTGEPTGVLKETAMRLVASMLPQPSLDDRVQALRAAIALAHANGITSVQNAGGSADDLDVYDELRRTGELDLRVYTALSVSAGLTAADFEQLDAVRRRYPDDPVLKTGAARLMVDGVVESHTAAMLQPYANAPGTGRVNFTPAELNRIVTALDARGWQVLIHAAGDNGVRMALDAFDYAQHANPPPARGRRHRVEHIETIDPADVARFGRLHVIASQQPLRGSPSPNQREVWQETLGPERASHTWPYGTLLKSGATVVFGSDWPMVPLDPRLGLHVATTRTAPETADEEGWLPGERLSLHQAIEAYTARGAYASFDEQRKGIIAPGMLADVVILSSDIFAAGATLLDSEIAITIFDGRVVYDRDEASTTD